MRTSCTWRSQLSARPTRSLRTRGADAAAAVVAAHDDVLHVEHVHRELDHRQAVQIGVDDDVRHVAVDEQLARREADDLVGRDAAVGAADPQVLRRLLLREALKEIRVAARHLRRPGAVVVEEMLQKRASSDPKVSGSWRGGGSDGGHALHHLRFGRRRQHVHRGELFRLRIVRRLDRSSGGVEVVDRAPQLDVRGRGAASTRRARRTACRRSRRSPRASTQSGGRTACACGRRRRSARARRRASGSRRSSAVRRVKISTSLRGVAWQKRTSPSPSIVSRSVAGHDEMRSTSAGRSCFAVQAMRWRKESGSKLPVPRRCASTSRSPLPMMQSVGTPARARASSASRGNGPGSTSPPTTMRSTRARRTSSSTASSAGALPWMS